MNDDDTGVVAYLLLIAIDRGKMPFQISST